MQHLLHRAGNRQFDVVAFGLAHDFVGGLDRFDHLADLAHRLVDGLPAPEREAQPPVARQAAGAGQPARAFRPSSMPSATPVATVSTFFIAPPSSAPTMSLPV